VRRRLALAAAAITTTIVLAFAIPLGLIIRTVANDRALTTAERAAAAIAPAIATGMEAPSVAIVVDGVTDPAKAAVSVVMPDDTVVGPSVSVDDTIELARGNPKPFSVDVPGGRQVVTPVPRTDGSVAVVSVFVPAAQLEKGVQTAWLLLAGLSVVLVLAAVAVADRLARTIVVPVGELAATAERLGQGDLEARVEPAGPPEIVEVGHVLNRLAGRIGELLVAERELVADLSHRLRTPITALRLDADGLHDPAERDRVTGDVDELVRAVDRVIDEARRTVREGVGASGDLAEVTRERVAFWSVLAEEQGRESTVQIADGPCPVAVTRDDLEAALDAALGNVLSHTPDGTAFRVAVEPVPGEGARGQVAGGAGGEAPGGAGGQAPSGAGGPIWRLVVEDDGPGFADAEGQLIERGASGAGSTGLGLDIVRRTAEHSGGSLVLGRSPTGGARLEVTFGPPGA
jgi:signal transduction histidine kinase